MAGSILSTFMMFTPDYVNFIFLTICCVGFFGIFIPYQESKKKGETWAPVRWLRRMKGALSRKKDPERRSRPASHVSPSNPGGQHRLEQLESLRAAGLIDGREYREKREQILKER